MRIALLAGGTGGAKLAHGFALLADAVELSIIANVGDDAEVHGLHVSPDLDAIAYHLAGLADGDQGWGIIGDTHGAQAMFERLGVPTWFSLGDADLATSVERTRRLRAGERLTEATAAIASALGLEATLLPSTDDRYRTTLVTDEGVLEFQEYFVRRRQRPDVQSIEMDGGAAARPTPETLRAIERAERIVIGPSNPLVSIGPMLELAGMREAISAASAVKVAVSPIIGGAALKGPADRMLRSMGHESSALGVARLYVGLVDRFVIDEVDEALAPPIEALGMRVSVLPTVMRSDADRQTLAASILAAD